MHLIAKNEFINNYHTFLTNFGTLEHLTIFIINILLFISAKSIVQFFENKDNHIKLKTKIFRTFNILFFILHIIDISIISFSENQEYQNILLKIGVTGLIIYLIYFITIFISHLIRKKFGEQKTIDEKKVNIETYASRLVNVIINIAILCITLISLIRYWGFNSMLETTGVLGLIMGTVVLTSNTWLPDLIKGLMMLNSKSYNEGDIIEIENEFYIIFKFKFFRTTILNIKNNFRTSISNAKLANATLNNYTQTASAEGLRQSIVYKIGYFNIKGEKPEERLQEYKNITEKIYRMFSNAYKKSVKDKTILISENKKEFEIQMIETGNYALHYEISFYIEKPISTNSTNTARKYIKTKNLINEKILETAIENNIDLSTPILISKTN